MSQHHQATPTSTAFIADEKIATAGMDGCLKILDIGTRRVLINIKEENVISSVTCGPKRRSVVTTSWNKTVKLYDIATGVYRHGLDGGATSSSAATGDDIPHATRFIMTVITC